MSDEARKRYNELRFLLRKIEDVADEAADIVDESNLPGVIVALDLIGTTAMALRSTLSPDHFEDHD